MTVLGLSYTVFASAVWPLVAAAVPPRKTGRLLWRISGLIS